MLYIVTATRYFDDETDFIVEIAGIFDTPEKAFEAREKVVAWIEKNEYDNYDVFVLQHTRINQLFWYDLEEDI